MQKVESIHNKIGFYTLSEPHKMIYNRKNSSKVKDILFNSG